jgi:hypothetical protein
MVKGSATGSEVCRAVEGQGVMRRKRVCVRGGNKALMVGQVTVNADQYKGTLLGIEDDGSTILNIAWC